jgi:hypothetical protein
MPPRLVRADSYTAEPAPESATSFVAVCGVVVLLLELVHSMAELLGLAS